MRHRTRLLGSALALACACQGGEGEREGAPLGPKNTESLEQTTESGPVKARVRLSPAKPRVGDVLTLDLEVTADKGARVSLPPFGEALGRFTVIEFTPRRSTEGDGTVVQTQTYQLQAPGSGRQRIPQLRIEFQPEAGGEPVELLTEELPVVVESVIADADLAKELGPAPEALDENPGLPIWLGPSAAGVAALLALLWWRGRRRRHRSVRHKEALRAFDRALERLRALESRGTPSGEELDDYFVELSGIVRRYLEDRLGLRAPELTTEEFLADAAHDPRLAGPVRGQLSDFLAICDRVKFAAYRPDAGEVDSAVASARSILEAQEQHARQLDTEAAA